MPFVAPGSRFYRVCMSPGSHVLVVNAGSSSLKYQLIDPASDRTLARGLVERLTSPDADLRHWPGTGDELVIDCPGTGPAEALTLMLDTFANHGPPLEDLAAIGHRVVHGGRRFSSATLIDTDVIDAIRDAASGEMLVSEGTLARVLRHQKARTAREVKASAGLTDRELEVLRCLAIGLGTRAIAEQLGLTVSTIRTYVQVILHKMDAHSRLQAVMRARERGML